MSKKEIPEEVKAKIKSIKKEIEELGDELLEAGFMFAFIASDDSGHNTTKLMYGDAVTLIGMMGMGIKAISAASKIPEKEITDMIIGAIEYEKEQEKK